MSETPRIPDADRRRLIESIEQHGGGGGGGGDDDGGGGSRGGGGASRSTKAPIHASERTSAGSERCKNQWHTQTDTALTPDPSEAEQ